MIFQLLKWLKTSVASGLLLVTFVLYYSAAKDFKHLKYRDDVITYDKKKQECVPPHVCEGIDISTIPYIFEHVRPEFLNSERKHFFDMKQTRSCLKGKKITFLGDSLIEEMLFDLATLLSGVAKSKELLNDLVVSLTRQILVLLTNNTNT